MLSYRVYKRKLQIFMFKLTPVTSKIGQGHPSSNLTKTLLRYSWLMLKMDELDLYVEVIRLISKLNLFNYKHDKHVTQSILVALIPNLYHGCISSSKMDDLDLSFFVRKCMFMTSPHSARRWIAWGVLVICTLLITSGTWQ